MTPREAVHAAAAAILARLSPRSRLIAEYERASPDRREAIDDALVYRAHAIAGPRLEGRPTYDVAAALILGAQPRDLAPGLTRQEAAQWVHQTDHETPLAWLWAQARARSGELPERGPNSIAVIRWVEGVMADPQRRAAALRERTTRADGEEVVGSCLDRLDELRAEDLHESVTETLDAATERAIKEQWDGPDELRPHEAWHDQLPPGVQVILSFRALYDEGREMRHCVAVYAENVARGACTIVSVKADDGTRSTAEIVDGKVVQHKGPRNTAPSPACIALLNQCRWT